MEWFACAMLLLIPGTILVMAILLVGVMPRILDHLEERRRRRRDPSDDVDGGAP